MEEMVVENEKDGVLGGEFDLKEIEEEMRMEKIRQAASKHTWEHFAGYLRKNLMEKRIVLDADDREDVMNALSDLREHMPEDGTTDFTAHLTHLADTLMCELQSHGGCFKLKSANVSMELGLEGGQVSTCFVSWFGEQPIEANNLKTMMLHNKWGTIENAVSVMLRLIPQQLQRDEKCVCMRSLELMENDLLNVSMRSLKEVGNANSLVDKINRGVLALCQPRGECSPFRIHLVAQPSVFFDVQSTSFVDVDEQTIRDGSLLPYAQLSVVSSSNPQLFSDSPLLSTHGEWLSVESGCRLPAAFCLRLSRPVIMCADSLRKLEAVSAVPLVIERGHNLYEYLMNDDHNGPEIVIGLPGCPTQRYVLDETMLNSNDDGIVNEVTFMHPRDAVLIVETIRSQLTHNALFESLVRAHNPNAPLKGAQDIRLTSASVRDIDLIFNLNSTAFIGRVNVSPSKMGVSLECIATGGTLPETQYASSILAKSWSIAVMMRGVLRRGGKETECDEIEMKSEVDVGDVKVSQCWLNRSTTPIERNNDRLRFEVIDKETPSGTCGLLALFKELDEVDELIPPPAQPPGSHPPSAPPRGTEILAPRTSRIHSENTMTINALSDLDAICDMAANIDDGESNVSEHSGRSSIVERCSPSAVEAQRLRTQVPPQSPSAGNERYRTAQMPSIQQLSPLEIARQRLAQHTPLSNTPDVFEFDDPPRMQQTAPFATSPQFQFPGGAQPPFQYTPMQPTRGSLSGAAPIVKRRGRGRKAANMGDRQPDHTTMLDPTTGLITTTTTTRRPRGAGGTRRPRRPRKAAQLAASQTHTHQFAMERPLLQRSFSEMHYSPQLSTAAAAALSARSETISEVDGLEESSDEETDPPPPTRLPAHPPPSHNPVLTPSSSQVQFPPSGTTSTTVTPSPTPSSRPTPANSASPSVGSSGTGGSTPIGTSPSASLYGYGSAGNVMHQSNKARKSSLEAVVGKLHYKSSTSTPPSGNPYATSDLYDDESEPSAKLRESPVLKREGASTPLTSSSPGARASPSAKVTPTSMTEQSPASDLRIIVKLKQQPAKQASTPQYPSTISPCSRLTGQPPSLSRSREDKALIRQRQLKEKARMQEERSRKSTKRERKSDSSGSVKKMKLERTPQSIEQKASRVEFTPQVPAFASLKNFKIPKVMESDCGPSWSSNAPTTSAAPAPSSTPMTGSPATGPCPTPTFTPKPAKSILKCSSVDAPPNLLRSMPMPPVVGGSGRRALLPDPRIAMHHPPRPMVPPPRLMMSPMNASLTPPTPASTGRWMALAPPKQQPSPNNPLSEQTPCGADKSPDSNSILKSADSPSEAALKIVADDE